MPLPLVMVQSALALEYGQESYGKLLLQNQSHVFVKLRSATSKAVLLSSLYWRIDSIIIISVLHSCIFVSRGPHFASGLGTGFASVNIAFFLKKGEFRWPWPEQQITKECGTYLQSTRPRLSTGAFLLVNGKLGILYNLANAGFFHRFNSSFPKIYLSCIYLEEPTSCGTSHGLGHSSLLILPDALLWYCRSNANTATAPSDATAASGDLCKHRPHLLVMVTWWLMALQCTE